MEIEDSGVCDVCATATQVRKTFEVNEEDSEVRESAHSDKMVCSDVLGLIAPASKSEFKYIVTFVMIKSRYVII